MRDLPPLVLAITWGNAARARADTVIMRANARFTATHLRRSLRWTRDVSWVDASYAEAHQKDGLGAFLAYEFSIEDLSLTLCSPWSGAIHKI